MDVVYDGAAYVRGALPSMSFVPKIKSSRNILLFKVPTGYKTNDIASRTTPLCVGLPTYSRDRDLSLRAANIAGTLNWD